MNKEYLTMAEQFLSDGDYNAARVAFNEILAENPHSVVALVGLSNALGHLGLLDDALKVVQAAFDIEPDNPEIYFRISWVYYEMKELHKARDYIYKAIELDPNVAKYHWEMARLANALKDTVTAVEHLEVAHRLDPSIFNKRAYITLWGLTIFVGLIKLRILIAWGVVATYALLFELGHSWFLPKLLLAGLPFIGASVYYLVKHRYRRALGAFVMGLLWGGITYAVAQWLFLR